MTDKLLNKLKIDDVYYCIHDDGMCDCRKPLPGLIYAAQKKWNIDLSKSIMFGDTEKDYLAAKKCNINFYLISNNANTSIKVEHRINNIAEAIKIIS